MSAVMLALIVLIGAAQYALCAQAIRDLLRRPRVRGNTKVLWALLILCVPIAGALVYNWMGPTSFVDRQTPIRPPARPRRRPAVSTPPAPSNVTPIGQARSAQQRRRHVSPTRPTSTPTPPRRSSSWLSPTDRTGS